MNNKNWEESIESLLNTDENLEEREKLSFLCSCTIDSLKAGGSVLIPFNRLGTLLQLLEEISASLESSTLKVQISSLSFSFSFFLFLFGGRRGWFQNSAYNL
jgi:integrator complex subunit 9